MSKSKLDFQTFILAGGLGTRLSRVVSDRPKPMADVLGIPFLEIVTRLLKSKGVRRFVMLVGYKAHAIEDYFTKSKFPDLEINFSYESKPLGTGGAVKNALHFATNPTLLVNGDTYLDVDIEGLYDFHRSKKADATISLYRVSDVSRYGSISLNHKGMVTRFTEKNIISRKPGLINAGVTFISSSLISQLPERRNFSMESEIFPSLVSSGRMFGLEQKGPFFDIGTPESYHEFQEFVRVKSI
ncbi:MAG: nucleotidyltransferase family protein [Pseudomonadota bacterium]